MGAGKGKSKRVQGRYVLHGGEQKSVLFADNIWKRFIKENKIGNQKIYDYYLSKDEVLEYREEECLHVLRELLSDAVAAHAITLLPGEKVEDYELLFDYKYEDPYLVIAKGQYEVATNNNANLNYSGFNKKFNSTWKLLNDLAHTIDDLNDHVASSLHSGEILVRPAARFT